MKSKDVKNISSIDLIAEFVDICARQKEARELDDFENFGRLLKRQVEIGEELKGREGDQRSLLVRLYEHQDIHVQLMASRMTLALEPVKARATLEAIYQSGEMPQSFDAGMVLGMLDEGMFTPS